MLLTVVALLAATTAATPGESGRADVEQACVKLFGPRVEPREGAPTLFGVNRSYVLRLKWTEAGGVEEAAIEPRIWFEEQYPGWTWEALDFEYLSADEAKELLTRIDLLRPLGRLVRAHSGVAIVTNVTAPMIDRYENAAVTRGMIVDLRRAEDAPDIYRYVRVEYVLARGGRPRR